MGSSRKGRDIDSALCKKGFRRDVSGRHIRYFLQGSEEIRTMMSHGMLGQTVDTWFISQMAHQLRLTKKQFLDLIDCTLDEEGYREILYPTDNQEEK